MIFNNDDIVLIDVLPCISKEQVVSEGHFASIFRLQFSSEKESTDAGDRIS
jgi:hypothetical protein